MELLTLVGTLSGAVLGIASTMATETFRARRDRRARLDGVRREGYAKYLQALTRTDAAMQAAAAAHAGPLDADVALEAFRSQDLLACRYELVLIASPETGRAAEEAYRRLRDIREALIAAHLEISTVAARDSDRTVAWRSVHRPYVEALEGLREAMRRDIQGG
ncbi:hypothetical protein [Yinghuangia seranimata]|uniref:hypothetical protein n=1 Tax=Yinghuangia seranimata TaxID=408067 RepID=UPI00248B13C6|nr:hypothetical protein [Yinghuangia seranimata]MDI2131175.1 hypothetical protein [Yinghuangia seranimata]